MTLDINSPRAIERMARDAEKITNVGSWPHGNFTLCVKYQPWMPKGDGGFPGNYGNVYRNDIIAGRFVVYDKQGREEVFTSVDEMVKTWSVD
jgi:hypothetical protein